jgi:hypothetical protein
MLRRLFLFTDIIFSLETMTPLKIGWGDLLPLSLIFKSPLLLKCLLKKKLIRIIEPGQPMSAIRWYTLERRIGYRSIVLKVLELTFG